MDFDSKCKRSAFITRSTDIREMFSFAHPSQVLSAVQVYAAHAYGSMLWDLTSEATNQFYRSWNTCVKLVWNVPRWSHNYFVDNLLAQEFPSIRKKILCQFVSFFQKLTNCPLREVRVLSKLVSKDIRSMTGKNLSFLASEFGLDPWTNSAEKFKKSYVGCLVPEEDKWRLPLLGKLLVQRSEMVLFEEEVQIITDMIDSLCSS